MSSAASSVAQMSLLPDFLATFWPSCKIVSVAHITIPGNSLDASQELHNRGDVLLWRKLGIYLSIKALDGRHLTLERAESLPAACLGAIFVPMVAT